MTDTTTDIQFIPFQPIASFQPDPGTPASMDSLMDVPLRVTVELGRAQMSVRQILELQNGAVVELDRLAGEAVDILVNDKLMARGEVVVVDDKYGIRITDLIPREWREEVG